MIKPDVILDTNYLADFLAIFYEQNISQGGMLIPKYRIGGDLCYKINEIVSHYKIYESLEMGIVISSTFAFVEIARQFKLILYGRVSIEQFKAFIDQPPNWFLIDSLNCNLTDFFLDVPSYIEYEEQKQPMEWTDSIHVAVAQSREPLGLIACSDHKIKSIPALKNRIIN